MKHKLARSPMQSDSTYDLHMRKMRTDGPAWTQGGSTFPHNRGGKLHMYIGPIQVRRLFYFSLSTSDPPPPQNSSAPQLSPTESMLDFRFGCRAADVQPAMVRHRKVCPRRAPHHHQQFVFLKFFEISRASLSEHLGLSDCRWLACWPPLAPGQP